MCNGEGCLGFHCQWPSLTVGSKHMHAGLQLRVSEAWCSGKLLEKQQLRGDTQALTHILGEHRSVFLGPSMKTFWASFWQGSRHWLGHSGRKGRRAEVWSHGKEITQSLGDCQRKEVLQGRAQGGEFMCTVSIGQGFYGNWAPMMLLCKAQCVLRVSNVQSRASCGHWADISGELFGDPRWSCSSWKHHQVCEHSTRGALVWVQVRLLTWVCQSLPSRSGRHKQTYGPTLPFPHVLSTSYTEKIYLILRSVTYNPVNDY